MQNPRIPRVAPRYLLDAANFHRGTLQGCPRIRIWSIGPECEVGYEMAFRSKMCTPPRFHLAANPPVDIGENKLCFQGSIGV